MNNVRRVRVYKKTRRHRSHNKTVLRKVDQNASRADVAADKTKKVPKSINKIFVITKEVITVISLVISVVSIVNHVNNVNLRDKLIKAENYYGNHQYIESIISYKNLLNEDIPIVKLNLAYMYSNGLGVDENLDYAIELYKELALQGNKQAIINLLSLYVNKRPESISDIIEMGMLAEINNIKEIDDFFACIMKDSEEEKSSEEVEKYSNEFYSLTKDEKIKILSAAKEKVYIGTGMAEFIPENEKNKKFISIGSSYITDSTNSTSYLVYKYKIYKYKIKYCDFIDENFQYLNQNNLSKIKFDNSF